MSDGIANVYLVASDRKPFLEFEWEDFDITDYTIVLRVRYEDDDTAVEVAAVVDDAAAGQFHFEWADGFLRAGTHTAEVVLTDGDGLPMTLPSEDPFKLVVREKA